MRNHEYHSHIIWDGNNGDGTSSYAAYGREYRILVDGKPAINGSANRIFRGEPDRHDPEDLFIGAISSCHMLAYLALCAGGGVTVLSYEDRASGTLALETSGGRFVEVTLRPTVTIGGGDADVAAKLHEAAHKRCFIASSCSVPIRCESTIRFVAAT